MCNMRLISNRENAIIAIKIINSTHIGNNNHVRTYIYAIIIIVVCILLHDDYYYY